MPSFKSVLFVCLGNICRSPTAHGVFEDMLRESGLQYQIKVDSAGTGAYHTGNKPDSRMLASAKKRGYDLSYIRARAVQQTDFEEFDLILAMDEANHADLVAICPERLQAKIKMFLHYSSDSTVLSVPDPYYGGPDGFEEVLDLVVDASNNLIASLKA